MYTTAHLVQRSFRTDCYALLNRMRYFQLGTWRVLQIRRLLNYSYTGDANGLGFYAYERLTGNNQIITSLRQGTYSYCPAPMPIAWLSMRELAFWYPTDEEKRNWIHTSIIQNGIAQVAKHRRQNHPHLSVQTAASRSKTVSTSLANWSTLLGNNPAMGISWYSGISTQGFIGDSLAKRLS